MSTKLERLLADIDPSRTYDQLFARADDAINSFSPACAQITDYREFGRFMSSFVAHVEKNILRLHRSVAGADWYWSRCIQLLCQIYGSNGEKAAFEMARTGNEGGLSAVLKTLAFRMAEDYAENEIFARIDDCWKTLTPNEQFSLADEYIEKYGHLLPSELTEASAARLRADLPRFLAKHPRILRKTRHIGR